MLMRDEMRDGTGNRRHREKDENRIGEKRRRQRAAERQHPKHVEQDVVEVGVQKRVGQKRP